MKRSFAQLQAKGARQVRGSSLPVAQGIPVSLPTRFPAVGAPSADWRLKSLYLFEAPQRSIDGWNRHDADALVAVYAEGGTYDNPRMDHVLTGQAHG
jgi:hypothetical protein